MKILYYIRTLGETPFIESQINDLSKNADTYIICNHFNSASNTLKIPSSNIILIPVSEPVWVTYLRNRFEFSDLLLNFYNPLYAIKLKKIINALKPDIIHCQFGYDAVHFSDNYDVSQHKIVITFRGFDASLKLILKVYKKKLGALLARKNVFPIFVAKSLQRNIDKAGIKYNDLNKVLYSNIDTSFYKRQSYNHIRNTTVFTQISNFREKKGHVYTIRAFEIFHEKYPLVNFRLIFMGEHDSFYYEIYDIAQQSKIQKFIEFIDKQDKYGVRETLEISHVFVHNSITSKFNDQEGIPNAIMEAMAMELPILTTFHSGIEEIDNGEVDIFFSSEKEINEYVFNIGEVIKFNRYSRKNRVRIVNAFNKDRFATELTNFYETVIDK